ncbi:MAG TPA: TIGR04282 family arsenosugar biosynthesis glycosyltransferase [Chitinivibrionales bacterium]|nr:TIGR04282 family arsenosugar biosynthesis glycosyltransferase [Chitinivibrionales bacterium]
MAGSIALRRTVIVFAKVPQKGAVKTRIAATHGDDCALAIYIAMLQCTAQTLVRFHHHVAYTGAQAPRELARYFPRATSFFRQQGRTLGERQKNAFLHCAGLGYDRFCLIGCDCPGRTGGDIAAAFAALDNGYDAVIGPAADGGYHLIAGSAECTGLFDVQGWSTPRLLSKTLEAAKQLGICCRLLEPRSDIDTYADFLTWRGPAR